jgi:hypothetical protein
MHLRVCPTAVHDESCSQPPVTTCQNHIDPSHTKPLRQQSTPCGTCLLIYVIIRAVLVRRAQRANGRVAPSDCGLEGFVLLWLFCAGFGCVCWLCCGGLCVPISEMRPGAPAPARSAEILCCYAFIKPCAGSRSAKRSVTTLLRWFVQYGFCSHCAAFANPFATLLFQDIHIPFLSRLVCFF